MVQSNFKKAVNWPVKPGILLIFLCFPELNLTAQQIREDSIVNLIQNAPYFTIHKDNYFITGVPLNIKTTKQTADVKFQISFKQRLTNAILPFKSFLYLSYTQKSFWNIYEKSSPFAETNYNPSLGISKFFYRNNKLMGFSFAVEHESNGRDSIFSRSWNRMAFNFARQSSANSILYLSLWIPFQYDGDNPDLLNYTGSMELAYQQASRNKRMILDVLVRKGNRIDWRGSLQTQLSWRITERQNQYLSLQWFTGYAESLIDYKEHVNMLRLGILIKPSLFVFY